MILKASVKIKQSGKENKKKVVLKTQKNQNKLKLENSIIEETGKGKEVLQHKEFTIPPEWQTVWFPMYRSSSVGSYSCKYHK